MLSMVLSVKDARGEPLEAIVDWAKRSNGLHWTAELWANGSLAHAVSGDARYCGDIARSLQETIILSGFRVPSEAIA